MTSLYTIASEFRQQLSALADLDMPPEAVADTVESLEGDLKDKLRAVIAYSLELEIVATGAWEAAKRMRERADSLDSRVKWLRQYAQDAMQVTGMGEIATDEWAAKLAKTPPKVVIAEGATIPAEFMRTPEPPAPSPDKTALKQALSTGVEIPGVSLVSGFRLAIR